MTTFTLSGQDSLRASSDGGQSNVFQAASTASHLGSHIRTHGGVDLMVSYFLKYLILLILL